MKSNDYFIENHIIKNIFLKNDYFNESNRKTQNHSEIKHIINEIIEAMNIPNFLSTYPNYIYNEFILNELSNLLWNSTTTSLRRFLMEKKRTPFFITNKETNNILKARILSIEGHYPNINLEQGYNIYTFRNNIPVLITENIITSNTYSEISFLNEFELKFASSIILSTNYPRCDLYFDNHNIISIDIRAFGELGKQRIVDLLFELLLLKSHKSDKINSLSVRDINFKDYSFYDYGANLDSFNELFVKINETDQLLMRTLFYLVKSRMLWENRCFGEDAISNVLFSIEGALLLMQRKFGYSDKNINIQVLEKIFKKTFSDGEEFFGVIKEGYDLRISIVHAHPREGVEWKPSLLADDYYDYYDISRFLFIYIILDRIIEIDY